MNKIEQAAMTTLDTKTVKIDDVVANYDGIVTINGLGFTVYKDRRVPVFSFVEGGGATFCGTCTKLVEFANELERLHDGNLAEINEGFRHTGVKIQIGKTISTKSGNKFRPVERLGTVKFETGGDDDMEFDEETGEVVANDEPEPDPF